jgi:DNA-binding LytR/AlgR family response regulator
VLTADAAVHAAVFACFGILLQNILRFGKYELLPHDQRMVNFLALAAMFVVTTLGLGYFFDYLISGDDVVALTVTLPFKTLTAILLYSIMLMSFYFNKDDYYLDDGRNGTLLPETSPDDDTETVEMEIIERIAVKIRQKIHMIPVADILYLQSEGDYVLIITADGKYLKEQTMKYFEMHLPRSQFVRIHRSYIINVTYISSIESDGRNSQQISLKNGQWLKASATGYKTLKAMLNL